MSELHQLPPGTLIQNRYEIVSVIGQGGFGITYKGHDRTLDTKVAIKEYYPSGVVSRYHTMSLDLQVGGKENARVFATGKEKFLNEARTLARFSDDPNVVSVRDFFEENQTVYIVMQYIEGVSLDQYLEKKGTLSFDETFLLLRPVMRSLADIHKTGLIHRDISPSNLIIDRYGKIKLIDFGTARPISDAGEKSLSVMLKPGYSPPEQYNPHGKQGPWSDVYGLCASIYKLITGQKPFNALERVLADTLEAPSALGAAISPAQEQVLLRGMAINEEDRFQTMEELENAFAAAEGSVTEDSSDERTVMGPASRSSASVSSNLPLSKEDLSKDTSSFRVEEQTVPQSNPVYRENDAAPEKEAIPKDPYAALQNAHPMRDDRADRGKEKPPKKKWPILIVAIVAVAALAATAYFLFLSGGTGGGEIEDWVDGSKQVNFRDTEITEGILNQIDRNQQVKALVFRDCHFSEESIKRFGSMKRITYLYFSSCTFDSTLNPLSELKTLEEIYLSGSLIENDSINGNDLIGADIPQVTELSLEFYQLKGGWEFLSHFPKVTTLTLYNLAVDETKSAFPVLPDLDRLQLSETDLRNTDLSAISHCKELKTILLANTHLTDVSFLEEAEALEHVNVADNALTSLDGLRNKEALEELDASNNQITDISVLQNCSKLRYLYADNNQINDISALQNCSTLTKVSFSNNQIEDVSSLAPGLELETLYLDGNQIADLSPIITCEKMQDLNISGNGVSDLSFCENMLELWILKASNNKISSLEGLHNVTQLKTVFLDGNAIPDISVLAKNTEQLKTVVLDNNQISDLSPLGSCPNLYAVSANNNLLTSLSGLENCTGLYYVSAAGNQISDISALKGCASLFAADLGENNLTDVSALGESEASDMALLLQNNQIKDISPLYGMKDYKYLVLYNNAITDITGMSAMTALDYPSKLYLSWWDALNPADLAQLQFSDLNLVDIPADRKVNLQNDFNEARSEAEMPHETINYLTKDEADAEISELRSKTRAMAGIEEETEEESSGDN